LCLIFEIGLRIFTLHERVIDNAWWKQHVKKNLFNYRDTDHKLIKPSGVFRILVLGDSQTIGHGIDNLEDTWPKRLENLLNTNLPQKRFEVINSAYQGWNTDNQLYELFGNGFLFNPDLVLLGYYLNDIPTLADFHCSIHDKDFLSSIRQYIPQGNQSKLFKSINFRLNRLSERFNLKPTYFKCLNSTYQSRSWESEKVYLDTMVKGIRLKGVHFMTAIIPVFIQLAEDYPFKNIHSKITGWFQDNGSPVLDLWKDAFFGMNASKLTISKQDRHLNKKAAEIIAQTVYKKLKPLKKLNQLHLYQKALNFEDLLSDLNWVKNMDQRFNNLELLNKKKEYDTSKDDNKESLSVWEKQNRFYIHQSHFYKNSFKLKQTQKKELNTNGDLIKTEILWYPSNSDNLISWNSITQKINKNSIFQSGKVNSQNQKIERKNLEFIYKTRTSGKNLKLEILKNVYFLDPKSLETAFSEKVNPETHLSNSETFNIVSKLIKLNPNLFFDFKNEGYNLKEIFNQLSQLEQTLIYKEIEWTKYFFTLIELGHNQYTNALINDILKYNPVPVLLRTVERFYFLNLRFKELNGLYRSNPTLPNRFELPTTKK